MISSKPRKQRYLRFNAGMHIRQHFSHAHVSKEAKAKLGLKRRTVQIRRGDTVKVMAGSFKGKNGKVNLVNMKKGVLYIDGISRKNAKGKELQIPIRISNVYITDLDLGDKYRKEKLGVA